MRQKIKSNIFSDFHQAVYIVDVFNIRYWIFMESDRSHGETIGIRVTIKRNSKQQNFSLEFQFV